MPRYERETIALACPGCQREMTPTYGDIIHRKEAKCKRCGSKFTFKSPAVSKLRSALSGLEKAQGELSKSLEGLLKDPDILLKR